MDVRNLLTPPDFRLSGLVGPDPFVPHPEAVFDGYYFRISLPSGATLVVIIVSSSPAKAEAAKKQIRNRLVGYIQGSNRQSSCECTDGDQAARSVSDEGAEAQQQPATGPRPDNHQVMITYFPGAQSPSAPAHIVIKPRVIRVSDSNSKTGAFTLTIPEVGEMTVGPRPISPVKLAISSSEIDLVVESNSRMTWKGNFYNAENSDVTPPPPAYGRAVARVRDELTRYWTSSRDRADSPAGVIAWLPNVPLYWHVHSIASPSTFQLSIPRIFLPMEDRIGSNAITHIQSNWGSSFPKHHIWMHGYKKSPREVSDNSGSSDDQWFMCAGGEILHTHSLLISFRGRRNQIVYKPPYALSIAEYKDICPHKCSRVIESASKVTQYIPLKLRSKISWQERQIELEIKSPRQMMRVVSSAPPRSFVGMATPVADGSIRPDTVAESMYAEIRVEVYKRSGFGGIFGEWELDEECVFENSALEFGAAAGLDIGAGVGSRSV